jgi:hypothetical protein
MTEGEADCQRPEVTADTLTAETGQLAAEIGELLRAWDTAEEVDSNFGADVEEAGRRLMVLADRLADVTGQSDPRREGQLRYLAAELGESVDYYADLDEHDTNASIDIVDQLGDGIALVQHVMQARENPDDHLEATADPQVTPSTEPDLYVLAISHRHGDDITLHPSDEAARAALAQFAGQWWPEVEGRVSAPGDKPAPDMPPGDDDEVTRIYFDHQADESYAITAAAMPARDLRQRVELGLRTQWYPQRDVPAGLVDPPTAPVAAPGSPPGPAGAKAFPRFTSRNSRGAPRPPAHGR